MGRGGFGRVVIRNTVVCCVFYAGLVLAAEVFARNACLVLLGGIFFCMALPYTRWGLRALRTLMNGFAGVAVDFHPRAKKEFLRREQWSRGGCRKKEKAATVRRWQTCLFRCRDLLPPCLDSIKQAARQSQLKQRQ